MPRVTLARNKSMSQTLNYIINISFDYRATENKTTTSNNNNNNLV